MKFIDAHTHLHDRRITTDVPGIVERAENMGVHYMVTCATMEENFQDTADLAAAYDSILPCFGIHPWFLDTLSQGWVEHLGNWLERIPSGIGETGLDFLERGADRDLQLEVFKKHLALAIDLKRPINIHIRKAWDALIHVLKGYGPLPGGGLVHSFSGSADLALLLARYNVSISFSGSVTRPKTKKKIRALKAASLDRILFETDTPDIFPTLDEDQLSAIEAANGKGTGLNEPRFVPAIVEIAARRRGIGFEEMADHGYNNALRLFAPLIVEGGANDGEIQGTP